MNRLVKFSNGKYGVRKCWFFGWYFKDLTNPSYFWRMNSKWFGDCMGSEDEARKELEKLTYEVIK
jgi:hypothetical protein